MKHCYLLLIILSLSGFVNVFPQTFVKVYDSRTDSTIRATSSLSRFAFADLDKNSLMDILICGVNANVVFSNVYYQSAPFKFSLADSFLMGAWLGSPVISDFNSDNRLDIVINGMGIVDWSPQSAKVEMYVRQPDLSWRNFSLAGVSSGDTYAFDMDNDGLMEYGVIGWNTSNYFFQTGYLAHFNSPGIVTTSALPATPAQGTLRMIDYNQDGYTDIYVSGRYMNGEMTPFTHIYFSDGAGGYSGNALYDLKGDYNRYPLGNPQIYDFNADGKVDMAGTNYDGYFFLYNTGNKTFTRSFKTIVPNNTGDYDNDGDLDNLHAYNQVYRNMGNYNYTLQSYTGFENITVHQNQFVDLDQDGDLDIVQAGIDSNGKMVFLMYRNDIALPNQKPQAPKGLSSSQSFETVKLAWNKGADFETPVHGLTYNYYCRSISDTLGSPMADFTTGYRYIPQFGNTGFDTLAILKRIPYGTYYWAVQTIDNNFYGSAFSPEKVFIVRDFELSKKQLCTSEGTRINFTGEVLPDHSYQWDFSNADTVLGTAPGPYVLRWDTPGQKIVKLRVKNPEGREISETSDTLIVLARPTSTFSINERVALNEAATALYTGNTVSGTFNWNFDGAGQAPTGKGPHQVSWATLGEKAVTLVVTNAAGCASVPGVKKVQVEMRCSFSVADTLCAGEPTQVVFDGVAGPEAMYNWVFTGATQVIGTGRGPYTVMWNTPGPKKVSLQLADGMYVSENVSDTVYVEGIPQFQISGDSLICRGSTTTLTAEGSSPDPWTYTWSSGHTTPGVALKPAKDSLVTVTVRTRHLCSASKSKTIRVTKPRENVELCLVTVNAAGKNLLVWEKPKTDDILRYRIYKESATAGYFKLAGEQDVSAFSVFADNLSDPASRSDRYKIAIVDTCGNESPMSPYHKTIHLAVSPSIPTGYNLSWDHIEIEKQAGAFGTYYIYRGASYSSLDLIDSIPSSLNQFRDANPPPGQVYYQISAKKLDSCYPSGSKKAGESYGQSFSNVEEVRVTNVNTLSGSHNVRIRPNPFSDETLITIDGAKEALRYIRLTDVTGKVVFDDRFSGEEYRLNRGHLAPGIYFLKIEGGGTWVGKIVISN
jgi:hypothetical protein